MLRPLHDYIVVQPHEDDTVTAGGILLANADANKPLRGTVVAVGKGKVIDGVFVVPDVKAGDTVMFARTAGTLMKVEGKDFVFMRQDDILGVIV